MSLKTNEEAVKHAKELIYPGKINTTSHWSEAQPTTTKEDRILKENGLSNVPSNINIKM